MRPFAFIGAFWLVFLGFCLSCEIDPNSKVYYFAYGSHMLGSCLKELRVNSHGSLGFAVLFNYSINYSMRSLDGTGKPNIDEAPGGLVYGVLYKLPFRELTKIDRAEFYQRKVVTVIVHGIEVKAVTYVAQPQLVVSSGYLEPSEKYTELVIAGATQNEFPANYITHLRKAAKGIIEPYTLNI